MEHIFEYYTLRLTTKSPVFVGSGQSISKKEFCFVPQKDVIRFMDMEKLIEYFSQSDRELELFEKFMLNDLSLKKEGELGTKYGEECFVNGLNAFLNLIGMKVGDRKKFVIYEIANDGMFEKNKTVCEINRFMRGADGRAYIPGSSVKGMLRTALLQQIIRQNPDKLPFESDMKHEGKNIENQMINTLTLKRDRNGIPNNKDAVNSIMKGISISDSEPISNDSFTVCKKIDLKKDGSFNTINLVRECIKPYTEVVFHLKVDKRYFKPVGIQSDFEPLFREIIRAFDEDYRNFYLTKFRNLDFNEKQLKNDFLVLGGGSGYFGKNVIYTPFGFEKGLKKVSDYMKTKTQFINGKKVFTNSDDYGLRISPHILKITQYQGEMYHMGICDVDLERETI